MTVSFLSGLLRRARSGDEEAFVKVVEATRERLFWTVKRMVGREALAEEILQDAYMALWDMPGEASPDNPEAWLRRVCVNRALDHLRREETRSHQLGSEALDQSARTGHPGGHDGRSRAGGGPPPGAVGPSRPRRTPPSCSR